MGDDMEIMHWASDYEVYREMGEELDRALRYDNAPHHPELPSFPCHVHIEDRVEPANPPDLQDQVR